MAGPFSVLMGTSIAIVIGFAPDYAQSKDTNARYRFSLAKGLIFVNFLI
jgi:hypothetical protein